MGKIINGNAILHILGVDFQQISSKFQSRQSRHQNVLLSQKVSWISIENVTPIAITAKYRAHIFIMVWSQSGTNK